MAGTVVCPDCGGRGVRIVPRRDETRDPEILWEVCATCQGSGRVGR